MVNWLNNIRLKNLNLPAALSAFLVLLFLTSLFCMFFVLLLPVLVNEAKVISSIDLQTITLIYQEPINTVETYLRTYNIIASINRNCLYSQFILFKIPLL